MRARIADLHMPPSLVLLQVHEWTKISGFFRHRILPRAFLNSKKKGYEKRVERLLQHPNLQFWWLWNSDFFLAASWGCRKIRVSASSWWQGETERWKNYLENTRLYHFLWQPGFSILLFWPGLSQWLAVRIVLFYFPRFGETYSNWNPLTFILVPSPLLIRSFCFSEFSR